MHVDVGIELEAAARQITLAFSSAATTLSGGEDRELVIQADDRAADVDRVGRRVPVLQLLGTSASPSPSCSWRSAWPGRGWR